MQMFYSLVCVHRLSDEARVREERGIGINSTMKHPGTVFQQMGRENAKVK
jgi:hypothetical protein